MDLREKNDPETGYTDPPGTRSLVKGSFAVVSGILLGLTALVAAAFGILPALVILVLALPLTIWGTKKLRRNEGQIRPDERPPSKVIS